MGGVLTLNNFQIKVMSSSSKFQRQAGQHQGGRPGETSDDNPYQFIVIFLCSRFVCSGEKNATIVRIETVRNLQAGEENSLLFGELFRRQQQKLQVLFM